MKALTKNQAGFSTLSIVAIVAVVAAAILATFFMLKSKKESSIQIGAIIPLSGPAAHHAAAMEGMRLAADEVNSWGGINGRKIEFIIEDSKSNPEEGKKAFNKIEAAHHPILYVSTASSVSMALAPLAEQNEVVLVGLVVSTPMLTKKMKWVFRYFAGSQFDVPPILDILRHLNVKRLGILYQNDEYGSMVFDLLKEDFEKAGGTIRSESFEPKEVDFKSKIVNLKDMEAIYAVGFESLLKNVVKQLREKNFRGFILCSSGASSPNFTGIPDANGVYVAAPVIFNADFLFAKEAREKYEHKYNKPFNMFAANGYDFVKYLAGLLENKEVSRKSLKVFLEGGFEYSGVFGNLIVRPGEHDIDFALHPAQIVNGKLKYLH